MSGLGNSWVERSLVSHPENRNLGLFVIFFSGRRFSKKAGNRLSLRKTDVLPPDLCGRVDERNGVSLTF
jgi:hypothetical protein